MILCFVLNQLYKSGGVERTLHTRINQLKENHDIHLILLENKENDFYYGNLSDVSIYNLNLKFDREDNDKIKLTLKNFIKVTYAFFKIQKILWKIKPDFTTNVVSKLALFFLPFLFRTGVKVIEHHASFYESMPGKFSKLLINKFEKHIFLTEEELMYADFVYKSKFVIPNPVNANLENIIPYKKKLNRIIAAGRIVDIKGFDRLIKSWEIIYHDFPDWELEIYGEPNSAVLRNLEEYISNRNIKRIYINAARADIIHIMNESKIYAMTSHFECFPMVLLEAMSVEMLIISFDCPTGPRNIVNNNTGYLVENNNILSFAEHLRLSIIDEEISSVKASRAYLESNKYSLDIIINKWENFFKENSSN